MPGYKAAATLRKTILDIPFDYVDEIVFVDDFSPDNTVEELKSFCKGNTSLTMSPEEYSKDNEKVLVTIHVHDKNKGYGGNQKTCYDLALKRGADIVVMIHPDYQYDPKLLKYFVEYINDGYFDVMLGSRIRSRKEALAGGMPAYKYYSNRFLSFVENLATGRVISDWHTGMRAYKREVLESLSYRGFSDDFIFDTQMLFAIIGKQYSIGDIPVPVRYFKEASSINFKRSLEYGIFTLWEVLKFLIKELKNSKVFRYIFAGAIALFSNLFILYVLVNFFKIWYLKSAIISFFCGMAVSYLLQKFFTFKDNSFKKIHTQFFIFCLFNVSMLLLNILLMYVFVELFNFWYIYAQISTTLLIAFANYQFFNRVIFKIR